MIDVSKLPEEQKAIAELVGADAYEMLVKKYGGNLIYIPTVKSVERHKLRLELRKAYNGANAEELAQKYGISAKTVMRIITKRPSK